jgi:hypothetical protein
MYIYTNDNNKKQQWWIFMDFFGEHETARFFGKGFKKLRGSIKGGK